MCVENKWASSSYHWCVLNQLNTWKKCRSLATLKMGMTLWPLNTTCILCCISMHQISYLICPLPRGYFSHFKFFTRPTCCNLIFTTLGAAKVPINLPCRFWPPSKTRGLFHPRRQPDASGELESTQKAKPFTTNNRGFFRRRWQPWRTTVGGHTRRRARAPYWHLCT